MKKNLKKVLAMLLAMVMMAGCLSMTAFAAEDAEAKTMEVPADYTNPFSDVSESDWYYEAVSYFNYYGTIKGKTATSFAPATDISRAEFAVMLYREFVNDLGVGKNVSTAYSSKFRDVADGTWYTAAIMWCSNMGLITGYTSGASAGSYGVADPITREQMVTIIERAEVNFWYEDIASLCKDCSSFPDYSKVSSWAKTPMQFAVGFGIISGVSHSGVMYLEPQSYVSRATAAVMLYRWISKEYPKENN